MISLDEVNEEWKKQDARLDAFRSKAKDMHDSLIKEVESLQYDLYRREESERQDSLRALSHSIVQQDAQLRVGMKGPTMVKEKFQPSYWRLFNNERDLLQEISEKQFMKDQQHEDSLHRRNSDGVIQSGKKTGLTGSPQKNKKKLQTSHSQTMTRSYELAKGDYINHNLKSAIFASPMTVENDLDKNTKFFDSHLLGRNNSIDQLLQLTLTQEKITDSPQKRTNKIEKIRRVDASLYDPNAIGVAPVKGGNMSRDRQRPKAFEPLTKTCEIPDLADTLKSVKGGIFLRDNRFPAVTLPVPSSSGATSSTVNTAANPESSQAMLHSKTPGMNSTVKFSLSKRFPSQEEEENKNLLATPGPANYTVSRLFDVDTKVKHKDFEAIYDKYKDEPRGLSALTTHELSLLAVMGYQCDVQEHILYGRCNHPLCCRRSEWDKSILRSNDLPRVAGIDKAETLGFTDTLKTKKLRTQSSQRVDLSRATTPLLPAPAFKMLALYTAAFQNDLPAIEHLASLHVDPNDFNEENGYTALHIAVTQNNEAAVSALLTCFEGIINVNLPEQSHGNTPLHLACYQRLKKIVMLLCDEKSCDPELYKNHKGEYAFDVCFIQNKKHNNHLISHEIWQIIDVTRERNRLLKQLDTLTVKEKKKKIWER